MSWFHFTKLERLQRSREQRRDTAEAAKQHANENIFLIPHDIAGALRDAMEEERTFEEYFREKMPTHMRQALDLEISFWQHLDEKIDEFRAEQLTEKEYDKVKEDVRAFLVILIDLLHAEAEMVQSCLQQHYLDILQSLQARAAAVPL